MDFYCKRLPVHFVLEQAADIMARVFKVPTFCYFSGSYFYFVHLLVNVCFKVQKRKKNNNNNMSIPSIAAASLFILCLNTLF